VETKKISPRAAPWFRIKPAQVEEQRKQATKSIWADEVNDDADDAQLLGGEEGSAQPSMNGVTTFNMDQPTEADDETDPRQPAAKDLRTNIARPKAAPRPSQQVDAAAPQPPREANPQQSDQMMDMLRQMQQQMQQQAEESARKDALIVQLQQTISSLQITIQAMQQAMSSTAMANNPSGQPGAGGAAGQGVMMDGAAPSAPQ
jgi:multidrug efflux pump subunit AcrB